MYIYKICVTKLAKFANSICHHTDNLTHFNFSTERLNDRNKIIILVTLTAITTENHS